MTIINKDRLAAAQALVHRFAQAGTAPAGMTPLGGTAANMQRSPAGWPVTRSALADQLTARLGGTDEPNQMSTSYCGPAAFLYCLLEDRPDLYAAYAIGLWERGTHDLAGGGSPLHVTAHSGARTAMSELPKARTTHPRTTISDLDWMTMSSLSTSTRPFNWLLGAPSPADQGGSISYPWVVKSWFNAVGAPARADVMGLGALPISLATFLDLMNSWPTCWIILQIDVSLLSGGETHFFKGRHWVVVDPHRAPMVRDGNGKTVPIGAAAQDIWHLPPAMIERGDVLDGPLMQDWVTNLRLVSWGQENHAMSQQKLGYLVNRVYGGFAFSHFR